MLHYNPRHVSSINMPIFRRTNCIITASGIVTLCTVQYSMPDESIYKFIYLRLSVKLFFFQTFANQASALSAFSAPFSLFQFWHSFNISMLLTIVFVCLIYTSTPERIIRISIRPIYHVVMTEMSLCSQWLFWDLKKVEPTFFPLLFSDFIRYD